MDKKENEVNQVFGSNSTRLQNLSTFKSLNTDMLSAGGGGGQDQQTFLGLSISTFSASAGFGDESSNLTVTLVQDELNRSDLTPSGTGQDVYWDKDKGDQFAAIPVGSPVFFNFGREYAATKDAFLHVLDEYSGPRKSIATVYAKAGDQDSEGNYLSKGQYKSGTRGHNHFTFGGILQSYNQSLNAEGSSSYQVRVTDAREILSNVTLILDGWNGSVRGLNNIMNVYGLLEHNPKNAELREKFEPDYYLNNPENAFPQDSTGEGTDMYYPDGISQVKGTRKWFDNIYTNGILGHKQQFPITGTGMSRRTTNGIPYYRVMQGIATLLGFNHSFQDIFAEYNSLGLWNGVRFRGLKYALDLRLPFLNYGYKFNYDQINLLELAMEICEVSNHELFVELNPILDHPATAGFYGYNNLISPSSPQDMWVGVITMRSIDKSSPYNTGQIMSYINDLPEDMMVFNKDVGYELTNETLDKLVVGGQETQMHVFPSNHRVDSVPEDGMVTNLAIIPYYGTLNNAATIPKGTGSYSQIVLDASNLFTEGVGDTYVATEMELRAAAVSYEKWVEFLLQYNDLYMESIEEGDIRDIAYLTEAIDPDQENEEGEEVSSNYCITVPRNLWPPALKDAKFDKGEPKNPCHPPYGWPLYWHRARNIGVPQAGMTSISLAASRTIGDLSKKNDDEDTQINPADDGIIRSATKEASKIIAGANTIGRQGLKNARIIHAFLKKLADECLGKKWLVKIPQRPNYAWSDTFTQGTVNYVDAFTAAPFGFAPRNVSGVVETESHPLMAAALAAARAITPGCTIIQDYLHPAPESSSVADPLGALKIGVNLDNNLVYNYYPEPQGGWYPYDALWTDQNMNYGVLPVNFSFLKEDNGRFAPYVRFDNSENLDFSSLSSSDMTKQDISFKGKIDPKFINEESTAQESKSVPVNYLGQPSGAVKNTRTVHYVKVSLEEDFIVAPRFKYDRARLYGNEYGYNTVNGEPRKIFDKKECEEKNSFRVMSRQYYPEKSYNMGSPAAYIDLDNPGPEYRNGVYALITVPGKIAAHISSAFREGMDMSVQNVGMKHILQADVYKYVNDFQSSPPINQFSGGTTIFARSLHPSGISSDTRNLIRKAYDGLTYCFNNRINITSPSPVYPDMAVLPLRSEERCYGPWSSITIGGSSYSSLTASEKAKTQVGGKIEFVKDEELAPWNYGGYTYMTYQGENACQLGMSAQLTSERGGFAIASTPSGISLGNFLTNSGPVVTNINISFDAAGAAKTTYAMQSYTQSFGKIQKQRSDEIKKLSRLRKQIWDQRNKEVRRRSGKNQKDNTLSVLLKGLEKRMNNLQYNTDIFREYQTTSSSYSTIMSQNTTISKFGSEDDNAEKGNNTETGMQTDEETTKAAEGLANDPDASASVHARTASETPKDVKKIVSHEPSKILPNVKGRPDYPHPLRPNIDDETSRWT